MESIVERIRASKVSFEQAERGEGAKQGKDWASNHADYPDLRKMASIRFNDVQGLYAEHVNKIFGIEQLDEEAWFYDADSGDLDTDEFVEAYVEAVSEVWGIVHPQL